MELGISLKFIKITELCGGKGLNPSKIHPHPRCVSTAYAVMEFTQSAQSISCYIAMSEMKMETKISRKGIS
jgi:hypothetical protein